MAARRRRPARRPKEEAPGPERVPQLPRVHVSAAPIRVEARRIIRAPVQKVFQLVSKVEAQPRVTGLWLSADVLDRRPGQVTVQYRGYFAGVPLESVQRVTLQAPDRIEFRQTRGGLRVLQGTYVLQPVEGDTELLMTLEADVSMPLITDAAAARVLRGHVERTLEKVKLVAERELPRVIRRPRAEPETAPGEIPAEEPDPGEEVEHEEPSNVLEHAPQVAAVPPSVPTGRKRRRRKRRRRSRSSQTPQPDSGGQAAG